MAATLTLSSKVLNAAFAYQDDGVDASGTFSANDDAVVGLSGSDALGDFIVEASDGGYAYTLKPANIDDAADLADDAADLAALAAAIVAAINEELNPTPPSDDSGGNSDVVA